MDPQSQVHRRGPRRDRARGRRHRQSANISATFLTAAFRNPAVADQLFGRAMLGFALAEATALFSGC